MDLVWYLPEAPQTSSVSNIKPVYKFCFFSENWRAGSIEMFIYEKYAQRSLKTGGRTSLQSGQLRGAPAE